MNGKQNTLLLVAAAAVSAGAASVYWKLDGQANRSEPRQIESVAGRTDAKAETLELLQKLSKDVENLHAQVAQLQQDRKAESPIQKIDVPEAPSTDPGAAQAEQEQKREALAKAQREAMEASLVQEKKDAAWSDQARSKLSAAYGGGNGVRFVNADCRSTLCKVQMALDKPGKQGETNLRVMMDKPAPWPGVRFMQIDRKSGDVTMYMMRDGHSLPELPQDY